MEAFTRLGRVPWLRRIAIALCIVLPVLLLLYIPLIAAVTIWLITLLAAAEHSRLRLSALQGLEGNTHSSSQQTHSNPTTNAHRDPPAADRQKPANLREAFSSPLLLMVCCSALFAVETIDQSKTPGLSFFCAAACVSFSVVGSSIFTYARHPEVPEAPHALLYAWASAGLDLYFLWHYAVPLALGSFILRRRGGLPLAACLIAASAAGDSGALFCGAAFGRRRIMQRLSPNKTLAGVIGSLLWSLLAGLLLWYLSVSLPSLGLMQIPLAGYLVFSAITSVVGLFGDLVESAYKRCAGVKDSSSIFGPHGGALDRLDSLALPIPFLAFYLVFMGHI